MFEELFQKQIVKTYFNSDNAAKFSFNNFNESPHTIYVKNY